MAHESRVPCEGFLSMTESLAREGATHETVRAMHERAWQ